MESPAAPLTFCTPRWATVLEARGGASALGRSGSDWLWGTHRHPLHFSRTAAGTHPRRPGSWCRLLSRSFSRKVTSKPSAAKLAVCPHLLTVFSSPSANEWDHRRFKRRAPCRFVVFEADDPVRQHQVRPADQLKPEQLYDHSRAKAGFALVPGETSGERHRRPGNGVLPSIVAPSDELQPGGRSRRVGSQTWSHREGVKTFARRKRLFSAAQAELQQQVSTNQANQLTDSILPQTRSNPKETP